MNFDDQITELLDNDHIVTARWLSITLRIQIDQARDLLQKYSSTHEVIASYLISGVNDQGIHTFCVAYESKLNDLLKNLKSVTSKEIYSIQRDQETKTLGIQLHALDTTQAIESLNSEINMTYFVKNEYGQIILPELKVSKSGQRIETPYSNIQSSSSTSTKESAEDHIARMFSNRTTSQSKSTNVANYFNAQTKQLKEKDKEQGDSSLHRNNSDHATSITTLHSVVPAENGGVSNKPKVSKDDDEEEWDDGTETADLKEANKKRKLERLSKSNDIGISKENDPRINDKTDNDIEPAEGKKPSKPKAPKVVVPVHGAMDDFISDNKETKIIVPSDEKKMKKKLVEKVFMDDKGYLITEMVYEDVEDDENEAEKPSVPQPISKPVSSTVITEGKKQQKKPVPPSNQRSMTSFFSKK